MRETEQQVLQVAGNETEAWIERAVCKGSAEKSICATATMCRVSTASGRERMQISGALTIRPPPKSAAHI